MSTPGDMRRAQRKTARAKQPNEPKPQATDLTPLELAIERKMRELARKEAPKEVDAKAIGVLVIKHWGNDAPEVLELAVVYVRDELGRWSPKDPKTGAGRVPTPGEGERQ